jgi:hypothetical protein
MSLKNYLSITAVIFLIISVLHLTRAVQGWEVLLAGWMVPTWASWVAILIAGFLSYSAFTLNKRVQ